VAEFGDDRPSDLGSEKRLKSKTKEDLNYGGKTEWPVLTIARVAVTKKLMRTRRCIAVLYNVIFVL